MTKSYFFCTGQKWTKNECKRFSLDILCSNWSKQCTHNSYKKVSTLDFWTTVDYQATELICSFLFIFLFYLKHRTNIRHYFEHKLSICTHARARQRGVELWAFCSRGKGLTTEQIGSPFQLEHFLFRHLVFTGLLKGKYAKTEPFFCIT